MIKTNTNTETETNAVCSKLMILFCFWEVEKKNNYKPIADTTPYIHEFIMQYLQMGNLMNIRNILKLIVLLFFGNFIKGIIKYYKYEYP